MTCIVGIEYEGSVWLGGDSVSVCEDSAWSVTDPKVFINKNIGFGYCGSFRGGQLLKYGLEVPLHPVARDDMGYLVIDLVDSIRALWTSKGILQNENGIEAVDTHVMVGYNGKLYYTDEDMQVCRTDTGYYAMGCGKHFALGALHALQRLALTPELKLQYALEAASAWSGAVRGPWNIIRVPEAIVEKKSTNLRKKTKI